MNDVRNLRVYLTDVKEKGEVGSARVEFFEGAGSWDASP